MITIERGRRMKRLDFNFLVALIVFLGLTLAVGIGYSALSTNLYVSTNKVNVNMNESSNK